MQLEIRLYATLRQYAPPGSIAGVFSLELPEGKTVDALAETIGICPDKVHMRMVNGIGVAGSHHLKDHDRVGLFPPVGGG